MKQLFVLFMLCFSYVGFAQTTYPTAMPAERKVEKVVIEEKTEEVSTPKVDMKKVSAERNALKTNVKITTPDNPRVNTTYQSDNGKVTGSQTTIKLGKNKKKDN